MQGLSPGAEAPDTPRLVRGRRLCWAPAWSCSDGHVVFDAASGDYWVLSPLAARIVRSLDEGTPVAPQPDDDEDWVATVDRLRQVGLIDADPS